MQTGNPYAVLNEEHRAARAAQEAELAPAAPAQQPEAESPATPQNNYYTTLDQAEQRQNDLRDALAADDQDKVNEIVGQYREAGYEPQEIMNELQRADQAREEPPSPVDPISEPGDGAPGESEPPPETDMAQDADAASDQGVASEPDYITEPEPEPSASDYQGWDQPEEPSQVSSVDLDAARRDGMSADDYHGWARSEQGQDQEQDQGMEL